jgi:hypothetical protein
MVHTLKTNFYGSPELEFRKKGGQIVVPEIGSIRHSQLYRSRKYLAQRKLGMDTLRSGSRV